jgi:hypothetical protein
MAMGMGVLSMVACGGGGGGTEPATTGQQRAAGQQPARPAPAGHAPGSSEDLLKQWGPDTMPDRTQEPEQFFYWRVDEMFRQADADQDGMMTFEEYGGMESNFQRLDANGDGVITKKEVIDDQLPREVPTQTP